MHVYITSESRLNRSQFKLIEALERFNIQLNGNGSYALDLGASPGGWSKVLFSHGYNVIAIDKGELDNSLKNKPQIYHIKETIKALKNSKIEEVAYDIALSLKGKIPLIYASDRLFSVAYRWKCDFNENSEVHAFAGRLPELCHNEVMGFRKKASEFHVVLLKDAEETTYMKRRFEATKEVIKSRGFATTEVLITGSNELTRLFSAFMMGSLASYYLALEEGVDPRKIDLIQELKEKLKR